MLMPVLAAFDFLTVWRLPGAAETTAEDRGRSVYFFWLVGLAIGGVLALVDLLTQPWWRTEIASVFLLAVLLLTTGGLHFDGLLDTCDGVFSHRAPEQRLEIMRDSRSGAFAVAAGVLTLLLWWACSVALPGEPHFA